MLAAASKSSALPVDSRNSLLVSPLPPTQTRFHPASKPWLIQFWEVPFWKVPFLGKCSGQPMFLSLSTTKNPGHCKTSTRRHTRQRGSELFGLSFLLQKPKKLAIWKYQQACIPTKVGSLLPKDQGRGSPARQNLRQQPLRPADSSIHASTGFRSKRP